MFSRAPSQSLPFTFIALFLVSFGACATESNQPSPPSAASVAAFDAQVLLIQGDRTVEGLVEHVTDDTIKVNIGEMQPLFLPMKEAREKGFPSIKPGDKLKIVLNDQNHLIIDFHPVNPGVARTSPPKGAQQRIEGMIVKSLSESEIRIKLLNGEERPYEVRSIAYDKLAAMKEGQDVILLVTDDNTVVDVAAPPEGKN